jgi:hypothetical protein
MVSVMLGLIACAATFTILAMAAMVVWPDYAIYGQRWLDQRLFSFTPVMAGLTLIFWACAFAAAGLVTALFSMHRTAVWATAGLMLTRAAYVHLYQDWSLFPWWYNVILVCSVVPMTLWGSRWGYDRRASAHA